MEILRKWWFWTACFAVIFGIALFLLSANSCREKTLPIHQLRYDVYSNSVVHDFSAMCKNFEFRCEQGFLFFKKQSYNERKECETCYLDAILLKDNVQVTKGLLNCEKRFSNSKNDWDVVCADYFDTREAAISEKNIALCRNMPDSPIRFAEDSQSSCRDVCLFIAGSFLNDFSQDYCALGMTKRLRNDCYIMAAKMTKNILFCDKTTLSWFKTPVRDFTLCFDLGTNETSRNAALNLSFCEDLTQSYSCRFEISSSISECNKFMLTLKQRDLCYLKFINSIEPRKDDSGGFSCDDFNSEEGKAFCREAKKRNGRFSFP